MKKRNFVKSIVVLGISFMVIVGYISNAYATDTFAYDPDAGKILTAEEVRMADDKIALISILEAKQLQLESQIKYVAAKSCSRATEVNEEISLLDKEIEAISQELYDLGVAKPSEVMLKKLVGENSKTVSDNARYAGHPSDFVSALEDKYNAWGYSTIGTDDRQQYHIILRYKSDPNFSQSGSVIFLGEYETGSDLAEQFLSMCVDMVVNMMSEELPIVSKFPWEYLFDTKPNSQVISCPGDNSVSGDYGIVSNMKFVAVYNEITEDWEFVLSTSRVIATYELRAKVLVDNTYWEIQTIQSATGEEIAGRFHYSIKDATDAFAEGICKNTCLTEWIWRCTVVENGRTITKNIVELTLPASSRIIDYVDW